MRDNLNHSEWVRLMHLMGVGESKRQERTVAKTPKSQTKMYTFQAKPGTNGVQRFVTAADSFSEAKSLAGKQGLRGTYLAKVGDNPIGDVLITG